MHRNSQINRRPASTSNYPFNNANTHPIKHQVPIMCFNQSGMNNSVNTSTPLNKGFSVVAANRPNQTLPPFRSPSKAGLNSSSYPNIYFTYINSRSLQLQKQQISTVLPTNQSLNIEWQQKYSQLQKQMNQLLSAHEKSTQDLLKQKDQLYLISQHNYKAQLQNYQKTLSIKDLNITQLKFQYDQLIINNNQLTIKNNQLNIKNSQLQSNTNELKSQNNQQQQKNILFETQISELKVKIQHIEQQCNTCKQQNNKITALLQKISNQLITSKNLNIQLQSDKNKLLVQIKQFQFQLQKAQLQKQSTLTSLTLKNDTLGSQLVHLKQQMQAKSKQLHQLANELLQLKQQQHKNEKQKSPDKSQQKIGKIKTQYQKKQKKLQKIIQSKNKQNSQLRAYITELQEKQRISKQMKEKFQTMYRQIKQQRNYLKNLQQASAGQGDAQKIAFYEQRIQQLNKIAKQQGQIIKKVQQQRKKMEDRINQYQDNYVSQKQLAQLHNAIEQHKNKLLQKGGVTYDQLNNKAYSYFNGKIFQQKLIYQLKKDNQKLIKILNKINLNQQIQKPQIIINQNFMFNHESGSDLSLTMMSMIADTFSKLQKIANDLKNKGSYQDYNLKNNLLYTQRNQTKAKTPKHSPKKPKRKSRQRSYQQSPSIKKLSNDLEILKVYIMDLNQTCGQLIKQLQKQQKTQKIINKQQTQLLKNQIQITGMMPKFQQLIEFHKNKNKQLQVRVDELLQLNNFLKLKLSQKSEKQPQQKSNQQYWKNQVTKLKQQLDQTKKRHQKFFIKFQESQGIKENLQSKTNLYALQIQKLRKETEEKSTQICQNFHTIDQLTFTKTKLQRQILLCKNKNTDMLRKIQQINQSLTLKQQIISHLQNKLRQLGKNNTNLSKQNYELKLSLEAQIKNSNNLSKAKNRCESQHKDRPGFQNKPTPPQTKTKTLSFQYNLQLMKSLLLQIECLMQQIQLVQSRQQQIAKCILTQITKTLNLINSIRL